MKVYKPLFTTEWQIVELETDELKPLGNTKLFTAVKNGKHYGNIWENPFYKSREAVVRWIRKEHVALDEIIELG